MTDQFWFEDPSSELDVLKLGWNFKILTNSGINFVVFLKNDNLGLKIKILKFLGIQPFLKFWWNFKKWHSLVFDKETPCTTLVVCKVKCVLVRIVSYCKSEVLLSEVMCQFTQFKKHKVCHVTKSPLLSRDLRSRVEFLVPQWDLHLAGSHTA